MKFLIRLISKFVFSMSVSIKNSTVLIKTLIENRISIPNELKNHGKILPGSGWACSWIESLWNLNNSEFRKTLQSSETPNSSQRGRQSHGCVQTRQNSTSERSSRLLTALVTRTHRACIASAPPRPRRRCRARRRTSTPRCRPPPGARRPGPGRPRPVPRFSAPAGAHATKQSGKTDGGTRWAAEAS